jgi:hypothetical protein
MKTPDSLLFKRTTSYQNKKGGLISAFFILHSFLLFSCCFDFRSVIIYRVSQICAAFSLNFYFFKIDFLAADSFPSLSTPVTTICEICRSAASAMLFVADGKME